MFNENDYYKLDQVDLYSLVNQLPGDAARLKEDPEERLKRLRGDKYEVELMEYKGELVRADDVRIVISEIFSRVKMRLLGIPSAMGVTLSVETNPVTIEKMLKEQIKTALDELTSDVELKVEDDQDEV
jgi:phage terminase Nu1 subunit (DNA packaging protein)